MFNVNDIFEEVRSSVMSTDTTDGIWKEKLKLEAGKEYVLRLVPYTKEGKEGLRKTMVKYIKYSWQDSNGKWHSILSPRTWNAKCPVADYSYRIKYKGTKEEQEEMDKRLFYKAGAYCNVYVIKDPTNPSNEGKVKILDMGKKLQTLIKSALDGELDADWTEKARAFSPDKTIEINVGPKVYDLSPSGVNLVVRVTKNQYGLNDYSTSNFSLSDTNLGKTPAEIQEIYDACHDLSTMDPTLDFDEITKIFKETYLNINDAPAPVKTVTPSAPAVKEDEVPAFVKKEPAMVHPSNVDPTTEVPVDDWFKQNGFDTSKLNK